MARTYGNGKILLPVSSSSRVIALVGHTFAARRIFSSPSPLGSMTVATNCSSSLKTFGAAATHFAYPSHFVLSTAIFMGSPYHGLLLFLGERPRRIKARPAGELLFLIP